MARRWSARDRFRARRRHPSRRDPWPGPNSTPTTTNTRTASARPSSRPVCPSQAGRGARLGRQAYTALGCQGLARCDFFVERGTGRVLINEINTLPGFTPISMYPKLMEHEGTPVPQLIDRLIALAMERPVARHG